METGYVQIYTGNGKGKTTAALGLSLRAICAGKKVYIGQFIKGMDYAELKAMDYLPGLVIKQYGRDCFIKNKPTKEDIEMAEAGLREIKQIIDSEEYDVVVLDEINVSLFFNLIKLEDVIEIVKSKPKAIELVLTGRYVPDELIQLADLVTEMKEIKHYYNEGVEARSGIEF